MRKNQFRPRLEMFEDRALMSVAAPVHADVEKFASAARFRFTGVVISPTQINLYWTPQRGATGYLIQEAYTQVRWMRQRGHWVPRYSTGWWTVAQAGANQSGIAIGCTPNTTYTIRVVMMRGRAQTPASPQSFHTPIPAPPPPPPIPNVPPIEHPNTNGVYQVITGPLWDANGPDYDDVHQGDLGDCWLMAGLAEIAHRDRPDIMRMFTDLGRFIENGVVVELYYVRFYDNSNVVHTVLVDNMLPTDGAGHTLHEQVKGGDLWVALVEKAYAQAASHGWVTNGWNQHGNFADDYAGLNQGQADWTLHSVTGRATSVVTVNQSGITATLAAGGLIVIGTVDHPANTLVVGDHSYAILEYNPGQAYPYMVFNPWNNGTYSQWNGNQVYGSVFYATLGFFVNSTFDYQFTA